MRKKNVFCGMVIILILCCLVGCRKKLEPNENLTKYFDDEMCKELTDYLILNEKCLKEYAKSNDLDLNNAFESIEQSDLYGISLDDFTGYTEDELKELSANENFEECFKDYQEKTKIYVDFMYFDYIRAQYFLNNSKVNITDDGSLEYYLDLDDKEKFIDDCDKHISELMQKYYS